MLNIYEGNYIAFARIEKAGSGTTITVKSGSNWAKQKYRRYLALGPGTRNARRVGSSRRMMASASSSARKDAIHRSVPSVEYVFPVRGDRSLPPDPRDEDS